MPAWRSLTINILCWLRIQKSYARMENDHPCSSSTPCSCWYHQYLQQSRHTRLEETLCAAMYWKGMRHTIRKFVKNCCKCQINKKQKHKYGKLPTKLVITNPWEELCVDLLGPYTLRGKDGTEIDFMCLTMIDPAYSWFEIVELLVITGVIIPQDTKGCKGKKTHKQPKLAYFDIICND